MQISCFYQKKKKMYCHMLVSTCATVLVNFSKKIILLYIIVFEFTTAMLANIRIYFSISSQILF